MSCPTAVLNFSVKYCQSLLQLCCCRSLHSSDGLAQVAKEVAQKPTVSDAQGQKEAYSTVDPAKERSRQMEMKVEYSCMSMPESCRLVGYRCHACQYPAAGASLSNCCCKSSTNQKGKKLIDQQCDVMQIRLLREILEWGQGIRTGSDSIGGDQPDPLTVNKVVQSALRKESEGGDIIVAVFPRGYSREAAQWDHSCQSHQRQGAWH